jgi:hypothetical protein
MRFLAVLAAPRFALPALRFPWPVKFAWPVESAAASEACLCFTRLFQQAYFTEQPFSFFMPWHARLALSAFSL